MQGQLHADVPGYVRLMILSKGKCAYTYQELCWALHKHKAGLRILALFVHINMQ